MIALEDLLATPVPRDSLAPGAVAALEPWWRWALFALAWLWLSTVPAAVVIVLGLLASLPFIDHFPVPAWYANTIVIAGGVAFVAMWIPFVRRVRRRRASARTLIVRGAVIDAAIASMQLRVYRGARFRVVSLVLEHDGHRRGVVVHGLDPKAPEPGAAVPVLFDPDVPYVIVYGLRAHGLRVRHSA